MYLFVDCIPFYRHGDKLHVIVVELALPASAIELVLSTSKLPLLLVIVVTSAALAVQLKKLLLRKFITPHMRMMRTQIPPTRTS